MIRALVCAAGATAALAAQAQAPDLKKAESLANQVCAACHAADGNSTAPANPKIASQIPEYLHKQLVDFKGQGGKKPARESAIMAGMVANLSESEMKGLAAFYAGQKLRPAAAADKHLAALGQKLWRGGNAATGVPACAGCHGPAGAGMPAQYP
jgi:cytochrome c553